MSVRKMIKIDEELCNGCGECVPSCAEGAIQIIDGKAKLVADNLCDGLGACLGDCPQGALTVEDREADEFDVEAVNVHLKKSKPASTLKPLVHNHGGGGCPGSKVISFDGGTAQTPANSGSQPSALQQWPVQLHLVSPTAPYFQGSDVLLAADCTAFSVGDFHTKYLAGKSLAIACPKLDSGTDVYIEKLTAMIDDANINTLTVMIMEVPCCGGLIQMAREAASRASRKVPVKQMVVNLRGEIIREDWI